MRLPRKGDEIIIIWESPTLGLVTKYATVLARKGGKHWMLHIKMRRATVSIWMENAYKKWERGEICYV